MTIGWGIIDRRFSMFKAPKNIQYHELGTQELTATLDLMTAVSSNDSDQHQPIHRRFAEYFNGYKWPI